MRDDKEKLAIILECIDKIREYTNNRREEFFSSTQIQDAVVRNFQVIGEAIKDLSEEIKLKNPDVPWKGVSGFRDRVTHDYFDVDFNKVWNAVENEILPLRDQIEDIHRRIIYKIPGDREQSSKLERRLNEETDE